MKKLNGRMKKMEISNAHIREQSTQTLKTHRQRDVVQHAQQQLYGLYVNIIVFSALFRLHEACAVQRR